MSARAPAPPDLAVKLMAGDRAALARAITLVESTRADHRATARALIDLIQPRTGKAMRIGLTGVPGVGKSTAIDALGTMLTGLGHKVAVVAVDPSSIRSGGSILGDKTRMARLANDPGAFVRPSPSAGTLGGVAARTRETMLVCEAAGHDVIIVETVGIGQSETVVADMTDVFVVLMLPGAGDELQGIKKGVLELADILAVNKADGDNVARAKAAASEYLAALHILTPPGSAWKPPVLLVSGLTGMGLPELWQKIGAHRVVMERTGAFAARRAAQQVRWMWAMVQDRIDARLRRAPALRAELPRIEKQVAAGTLAPTTAAERVLALAGMEG